MVQVETRMVRVTSELHRIIEEKNGGEKVGHGRDSGRQLVSDCGRLNRKAANVGG
jgi:hypothetical protein